MVNELVQRVTKTYQQYMNLKTFFISVMNGEFNKKDQDFTKKFEQEAQEKTPAPDQESEHLGRLYQAPLSAVINKAHAGTHRHS